MMPDPLSNLDASKGGVSKIDPVTIPGSVPDQNKAFDAQKHRIRYSKIDLDDPGSIAELEILETKALRNEGDLVVGDNQPYAVTATSDYAIPVHGEARGLAHVELEIRQDLIADAAGQQAWARRLARILPALAGESGN